MNRTKKGLITAMLALLFAVITTQKVEAAPLCLAKERQKYENIASKLKFDYEHVKTENGYYYEIKVTGGDSNLVIEYEGKTFSLQDDTYLTLNEGFKDNNSYIFKIRIKDGVRCGGEAVATRVVSIPKYNIYSEYDICVEYEEAPVCAKYYKGELKNEKDFIDKLYEYINKTKSGKYEKYKDTRNIFQTFADFYMDNIEISVAITMILIAAATYFIVNKAIRRKNRVKL